MSKPKISYKKVGYSRTSQPSVRAVRNIDKSHLAEGLSRTEKDTNAAPKDFSALVAKINGVLENGEYSQELVEADTMHIVKLLGVKDCKAMGDNARLTIEMEVMKKGPKHPETMKVKTMIFMLTCNPDTAAVSTDYKGDHGALIEKFVASVRNVLKK